MSKLQLKIIIPVYNEEENISTAIEDWLVNLQKLDITFKIHALNDGSKDNTINILNDLSKKYPELVVTDKPNSGHGPTILDGYNSSEDAKWFFQTDSDNEMKAKHFYNLWQDREHYDFLIGYRDNRTSPISRRLITLISRLTVYLFYGTGVCDVNTPYRLMRTSFFLQHIKKIPEDTFAPNVIIAGLAAHYNARIKAFPVPHTNRELGTVSIQKWKLLKAALKSFYQTISYRFTLDDSNFK